MNASVWLFKKKSITMQGNMNVKNITIFAWSNWRKPQKVIENRNSGFEPTIFWTKTIKETRYNETWMVTF
jgi:hypothetical protein